MTDFEPEVKAMAAVGAALSGLQPDAVRRVLRWVNEKYMVRPATGASEQAGDGGAVNTRFNSYSDLFDLANPSTGLERILVLAYWYQVVQGHEDLGAQSINHELKNLGHPSLNITRDIESLIGRVPKLMIQVRKEGTTQQARKRYKITREGIRAVEKMLQAGGDTGA